VDVFGGLKEGGIAIINTEKDIPDIPEGIKVIKIDATKIALEVLGLPIENTTLMGAFAAASGEIELDALKEALKERFPSALAEKNIKAAETAYNKVKGGDI
jgi:pyruvate ferredoxin oxidoreductase gamma subunit